MLRWQRSQGSVEQRCQGSTPAQRDVQPVPLRPPGNHNKEVTIACCEGGQERPLCPRFHTPSRTQRNERRGRRGRRESAAEGEDEEEEGREEEEEQRPLCSGVLGYPSVREQSLALGEDSHHQGGASADRAHSYKGRRSLYQLGCYV